MKIETAQDQRVYHTITENSIPRVTDEIILSITDRRNLTETHEDGLLCPVCKLYPHCNEQPSQIAKRSQLEPHPDYRHL